MTSACSFFFCFFLCKFYAPGIAIQVCYTAHMHEARLRNPLCPPFHQKHHKTIRTGNLDGVATQTGNSPNVFQRACVPETARNDIQKIYFM